MDIAVPAAFTVVALDMVPLPAGLVVEEHWPMSITALSFLEIVIQFKLAQVVLATLLHILQVAPQQLAAAQFE
jgi:hypothetical protein